MKQKKWNKKCLCMKTFITLKWPSKMHKFGWNNTCCVNRLTILTCYGIKYIKDRMSKQQPKLSVMSLKQNHPLKRKACDLKDLQQHHWYNLLSTEMVVNSKSQFKNTICIIYTTVLHVYLSLKHWKEKVSMKRGWFLRFAKPSSWPWGKTLAILKSCTNQQTNHLNINN